MKVGKLKPPEIKISIWKSLWYSFLLNIIFSSSLYYRLSATIRVIGVVWYCKIFIGITTNTSKKISTYFIDIQDLKDIYNSKYVFIKF